MKILHFISGGDSGGAKTHVLTLLSNLRKQNIDVQLLCIMEGIFTEEARKLGIPITVIPQTKRYDLSVIGKICDFINESGADLVHCHGARANYIYLLIKGKIKAPTITTLHSDYKLDFKDNWRKQLIYAPINSFALRRFKHILTVTRAFRDMLVSRGFKKERLSIIYNGLDFDQTLPCVPKEEFFKAINVPYSPDKKYVGIAARLFAVKGVDVFLRAAKIVAEESEDIDFIVLGDGEMWDKCKGYIEENGLKDRVYMAGQVTNPIIMNSFYRSIDVNTLTSYSESFPYALLEGARMRRATIATAVGGVVEMIEDSRSGFLVPSGDENQLAERMLRLCKDVNLNISMGDAFYERAKELFSAEKMASTHIQIYSDIINKTL